MASTLFGVWREKSRPRFLLLVRKVERPEAVLVVSLNEFLDEPVRSRLPGFFLLRRRRGG